ncbi:site-2 protease family protein [Salinigranum halophilum]|mgnify:CR=1 FL=1|jgi:membrane-associated protease RseP (regulator of RpoE activity)|uniref:site-2 protease family protein n=1 Tax=Salinigranum halophilum TaxID=2565931 RepID=UPI0010A925C2|nr:site-2 protease family protein [Salinigranum halophilum]
MNTLVWVLVGVFAYSFVAFFLKSRGILPSSVRVQGPLTTLHTKRGRDFLDWLARPKRFWRAWSNIGVGITLVVMVGTFALLLFQGLSILQNPPAPTQVNQPQNFLVIPGVNDFLPLSVAPEIVFGLLVGLVVHEGGHGLLCRVENIDIESMGLVFLTLIPVGAFVEPDEESQRAADRGGRTRMFAAGVTNNFAITIVAFALLFGPVVGAIGVAPGMAVQGTYDGSPAGDAGIGSGDRILAVAGQNVSSEGELDAALSATDARTVETTVDSGDGTTTVSVDRRLVVVGTVGGNPANLTVASDDEPITVSAVNGTPVFTRAGLQAATEGSTTARLSTSRGDVTIPVGAYITRVAEDGPLGQEAPTNGSLIITGFDGERVTSSADLNALLDETDPGQEVEIRARVDGADETYLVTLGENPRDGNGFLGVNIFPGTSGLVLTDFGAQSYPAGTYLTLLGGEGGSAPVNVVDSPLGLVYVALILPLASVILGIPNFPGFTPAVTNFYVVQGPLSALGDGVFILANLLFWTAWINLQLGLFNCIPGYPLDGGRILRTGTEAIVSRLPVESPHALVRTVTTSVGLVMLASLVLLIFGPTLLN